jgi:hypothetical protein
MAVLSVMMLCQPAPARTELMRLGSSFVAVCQRHVPLGLAVILLFAGATAHAQAAPEGAKKTNVTFDARVKWFGTASALPARSVDRALLRVSTPQLDQNLDLRLMWQVSRGDFRFTAHHSTSWLQGDSVANGASQSDINPLVSNDDTRVADLTWNIDTGKNHAAWQRFDRLALQYQHADWSVTLGRQAVSWGSGLVFQPMDLFNPFTPTAVDRDYKPGNDLLLVEKLTSSGGDLQLLAVGRRNDTDDVSGSVGSLALKWRSGLGAGEFELLAGRHYGDRVLAVTLRWPLGGALVRTDIVATRPQGRSRDNETYISAIANIDYSFTLAQRSVYTFAEYYYNGFGASGEVPALTRTDALLGERLQRGELFTLQRNYLALGATYQWHPLWVQSLTSIINLHDRSSVLVTQLNYEPGDHQRLELGVLANLGTAGEEYGGVYAAPQGSGLLTDARGRQLTFGGESQAFVRWVYYF